MKFFKNVSLLAFVLSLLLSFVCFELIGAQEQKAMKPLWKQVGKRKIDLNTVDSLNIIKLPDDEVVVDRTDNDAKKQYKFKRLNKVKVSKDKKRFIEYSTIAYDIDMYDGKISVYDDNNKVLFTDEAKGKDIVAVGFLKNNELVMMYTRYPDSMNVYNLNGKKIYENLREINYSTSYMFPNGNAFIFTQRNIKGTVDLIKYDATLNKEIVLTEFGNDQSIVKVAYTDNGFYSVRKGNKIFSYAPDDRLLWSKEIFTLNIFILSNDGKYLLAQRTRFNILLIDNGTGNILWEKEAIVNDGGKYSYFRGQIQNDKLVFDVLDPDNMGEYKDNNIVATLDLQGNMIDFKKIKKDSFNTK